MALTKKCQANNDRKHTNKVTKNGNNPKNIYDLLSLMKMRETSCYTYIHTESIRTSAGKNMYYMA